MRPEPVEIKSVFTTVESPIGVLLLTSDGLALTGLYPASQKGQPDPTSMSRDDGLFSGIRDQLNAYFRGKLSEFTVPLKPAGTPFQQAVWQELSRIPWGVTRTCAEVAAAIARPSAARAVAATVGRNPIPIIVPCHRIVGGSGAGAIALAAGVELKQWLLAHEASMLPWRLPPVERPPAGPHP
jgi:methylated-DNA-[protein]-cysteine S-methyltransferase